METEELKRILAAYDTKLDKKLHLNLVSIQNLNLEKSKKNTEKILSYRIIEIVTFSLLALFMGGYIANNWQETHLAISGIIVALFTLIALSGSIGQVTLLQQIDFSKPILDIRKKIELVNAHNLTFVKLMLLSTPIWWAYIVVGAEAVFNIDLYNAMDPDFTIKYLLTNAVLVLPIIWLLTKLNHKNLHINWIKKTISLFTGAKTIQALAFLNEIEKFEN